MCDARCSIYRTTHFYHRSIIIAATSWKEGIVESPGRNNIKKIEEQRFSAHKAKMEVYASFLCSKRLSYVPVSELYRKFS